MKKINYLLSALCALFVCACSSSDEEPIVPVEKAEVSFVLDYKFIEGGSMSRANSDVYSEFYNDMIKTKALTPDNYHLRFVGEDGKTTFEFDGKWSKKDMITLLEGEYTVTGASVAQGEDYIQDKASLSFSQKITITKGLSTVTLTAGYDCFLLFFNKSDFSKLTYTRVSSGSASNTVADITYAYGDYYYLFSRNLDSGYFYGERTDGATFKLSATTFPFENGKYYFFNDVTNSFDIPEMEAGN